MKELEEFRFPIGRFSMPDSNLPGMRAAQIETLRQLPERLKVAVTGLTDTQLNTPYREGGWTVRQVVHHLADSHAVAFIRCKLALTEDCPTIQPYNEAAWAELADSRLPVDVSLVLIKAQHTRWVSLLESLSDEDFSKAFNHPERGQETLAKTLAIYDWHSRHHTAHITNLRTRQGW